MRPNSGETAEFEPTPEDVSALDDLCAEAFRQGFGVDMPTVLASESYARYKSQFERDLAGHGEDKMNDWLVGLGVMNAGVVLSLVGTPENAHAMTAYAAEIPAADRPTPHEAALVATLNDALLAKAQDKIGPAARAVARRWQSLGTEDEQLVALRAVYKSLTLDSWLAAQNDQTSREQLEQRLPLDELGRPTYDGTEPLLPGDDVWPQMEAPNCLGLAILMSGFAKEAGAEFVFLNQLTAHRHMQPAFEARQAQIMLDAYQRLGLEHELNPMIDGYIDVANYNRLNFNTLPEDFHFSIGIKTPNGIWIQLDPYMGVFGVMGDSSSSSINDNMAMLQGLWPHLPGMVIADSVKTGVEMMSDRTATFGQVMAETAAIIQDGITGLETEITDFDDFVELAQEVRGVIKAVVDSQPTLQDHVELNSDELVLCSLFDIKGVDLTDEFEITDKSREYYEQRLNEAARRFNTDTAYRQRRINDLCAFPISIHAAEALIVKHRIFAEEMREPGFEISNPDYMPALMTLAHLRAWWEHGNNSHSVRLLAHSSSQVLWHEAEHGLNDGNDPIVNRARRGVRMLHPSQLHERVAMLLQLQDVNIQANGATDSG